MIDEILPRGVVTAEAFGEELSHAELFPEEEQVIARSVDKRRHEFTAGRACARRALAGLGVPPAPLLPGERGAPRWPAGIVGSITHCAGYRAAAVARASEVTAVGIDAEPHDLLPDGVLDQIATPGELTLLPELRAAAPKVCWDRLLFSAKESIYKVWFPVAGRWLGFEDAVVTPDPDAGVFTARLLVPAPPPLAGTLHGRWMVRDGLALTTITILF
ncbi:4'-phosphopantetheinyl transferase family protein [Actinomadura alba]|uniref:4'-phosphopantetheinyl transferase superfamily protein n=1 Tax=Actinomadura alba TaxID=406431 RepID=A0ABR7M228_9ACTN|nr:4'-phosphopantetheinyl transferase superfamily protein [Actinomadura alba]MBC6471170.1 4'-phosphopantetheinyl transferase superfamily protein [Actinomadura alba]